MPLKRFLFLISAGSGVSSYCLWVGGIGVSSKLHQKPLEEGM